MAFISTPLTLSRRPSLRPTHVPRRSIRPVVCPIRRVRLAHMTAGVGTPAVDFSLKVTGGHTVTLATLSAKASIIVMYFYPRDATSGCTVEAGDFRDLLPEFEKLGATVVGVSKDSVESHDAFSQDLGLNFPLISDDGTLSDGYGVFKLLKLGEREIMAIQRSTFVIKDGEVVKEWRGVKSGGHAADVLEAVKVL